MGRFIYQSASALESGTKAAVVPSAMSSLRDKRFKWENKTGVGVSIYVSTPFQLPCHLVEVFEYLYLVGRWQKTSCLKLEILIYIFSPSLQSLLVEIYMCVCVIPGCINIGAVVDSHLLLLHNAVECLVHFSVPSQCSSIWYLRDNELHAVHI